MPHLSALVAPRPAVQRRLRAAGLIAFCLLTAIACRGGHDAAAEERERQEQDVGRLAEQAGRLAAGDSARGARTTGSDTGAGFAIGSGAGISRAGEPPLAAGDLRLTSTDGMLVLSLIGDTVRSRLGDSAVAKVRREMGAEADTGSGLGGFVARTVKGAVAGAMHEAARFTFRIPVREVREVRYENGELHLRSGKNNSFNARFSQEDADRFIAAVHARQAQPAGR